jgi:hypothetical protein
LFQSLSVAQVSSQGNEEDGFNKVGLLPIEWVGYDGESEKDIMFTG